MEKKAGIDNKKSTPKQKIIALAIVMTLVIVFTCSPVLLYVMLPPDTTHQKESIKGYRAEILMYSLGNVTSEGNQKHNIWWEMESITYEYDENGQVIFTGNVGMPLNYNLRQCLKSYNAEVDPEYRVTIGDVLYGLGEGLHETVITGENPNSYKLNLFYKYYVKGYWS